MSQVLHSQSQQPSLPLPADNLSKVKEAADPAPCSAVIKGVLLEGIALVKADKKGRVVIIHSSGVMAVSPQELSEPFLKKWGLDPARMQDAAGKKHAPFLSFRQAETRATPQNADAPTDARFDAWREIWSEFPSVTMQELSTSPLSYQDKIVRVKGTIGTVSEKKEEACFELRQAGGSLRVFFDMFSLAAEKKKSIAQKLRSLLVLPRDFSVPVWVVGEVTYLPSKRVCSLELIDFKIE